MSAAPLVTAAAAMMATTTRTASPSAKAKAAMAAASQSVRFSEITLRCGEGMALAAQSYPPAASAAGSQGPASSSGKKILCLHGWMDNCRSFHHLAPELARRLGAHVVALDLPGHGRSGHKGADGPPTVLAEAAYYVHEAVRELSWDEFSLVGHSMGAAVGCLYASAFPEYVSELVLLDGAGPLARPASDVPRHLRMHVERRQLASRPSQKSRGPRVHDSLEAAVQARMATARTFPGNQTLSHAAALELVRRGTRPAAAGSDAARLRRGDTQSPTDDAGEPHDGGPVQFSHDPRLSWPSAQYFTEEQNEAVYKNIQCPVAFLRAVDGWPFDETKMDKFRRLLNPDLFLTLPGSHHFHADPDTAPAVADAVARWLVEEVQAGVGAAAAAADT